MELRTPQAPRSRNPTRPAGGRRAGGRGAVKSRRAIRWRNWAALKASTWISTASRTAGRAAAPDEDDDYEPTMLLQTPGLLERVREEVREPSAEETGTWAEAQPEEISSEEDTPHFWTPDTLESVNDAISGAGRETEPSEDQTDGDMVALTDEFQDLLEEETGPGTDDTAEAVDEQLDDEAAWRAQLEGADAMEELDSESPASEESELVTQAISAADLEELDVNPLGNADFDDADESEEKTLMGEEAVLSNFRFPAPPEPSAPAGKAGRSKPVAAPFEEQLESALDDDVETVPFEEQLEAALDEELPDLQVPPVGALELPEDAADLEAVPFEEHLEARLADAVDADLGDAGLACPSCGAALGGVLAERLLELTAAVQHLRAEVQALSQRLAP